MPGEVFLKRLYDEVGSEDGTRILVDGLWPRGVRRSEWPGDSWRPEVAPSADLRRWFGHDPNRFEEFARRYRVELESNSAVDELLAISGTLTLVTAKRDLDHSHASVVKTHLDDLQGRGV